MEALASDSAHQDVTFVSMIACLECVRAMFVKLEHKETVSSGDAVADNAAHTAHTDLMRRREEVTSMLIEEMLKLGVEDAT
jgi:hypothetical protein